MCFGFGLAHPSGNCELQHRKVKLTLPYPSKPQIISQMIITAGENKADFPTESQQALSYVNGIMPRAHRA